MGTESKRTTALYACSDRRSATDGPRRIALLGATGSIGTQTLELAARYPDRFRIEAVTIRSRWERLVELLARLDEAAPAAEAPWTAVVDPAARARLAELPRFRGRLLGSGELGLCEAVAVPEVDCVVNALVGAAGLAPTLAAARRGVRLALANKESLVVGGELVGAAVQAGHCELLPVDSEHAAIAQCLSGRTLAELERIVLTASGGPFHARPDLRLDEVELAEVLRHPTWRMGPKITVDSATLMNKGLEVIEAHHLFGLPYADIEVVIHPGSVVHSLVMFRDGALLAQLGVPDMRVPLLYALSGEKHWPLATERLNLIETAALHFEAPDTERFPCLRLARQAGEAGGSVPVVLNGANEVAVAALLAGRLRFGQIPAVIAESLAAVSEQPLGSLEEALVVDREARRVAGRLVAAAN